MTENKTIKIDITKKEYQLLEFIRKFKNGKVELIIHSGQPVKTTIKEIDNFFDGNVGEYPL